jgi:uroporphyrinogen III methyltransferase/synthase
LGDVKEKEMGNEKRESGSSRELSGTPGKVYLVGTGPGDLGLLTIKGKEVIEEADCLVIDYLVGTGIAELARDDAEKIRVGKKIRDHTLPQSEINRILIQKAKEGKVVVRLKGGDPFIFGRGGEEAEALVCAGIPFEVIPGVTSAIAAPAYAGIPLTHRNHNSTVAFVTGHEDPTKGKSMIDWEAISTGIGTLVFLMGIKNLQNITRQLISHGRDPATPSAIIRWGTTSQQVVLSARLDEISDLTAREGIVPPAIFVVGGVVELRDRIRWFERKPLFGKRILITRARHQAGRLDRLLREQGAEAISIPTIEIRPPDNWDDMDRAIDDVAQYDWVIFTSVNGVEAFMGRLRKRKKDIRELKGIRIASIGSGTAQCIEDMGIRVDLLPEKFIAEGILEDLSKEEVKGLRFLLPRAEKARNILPEELAKRGARVDVVKAYKTMIPERKKEELVSLLESNGVDLITFTSSSTVSHFVEMIGAELLSEKLEGVSIASIGPVTAERARQLGIETHIMPEEYTIESMVREIVRFYNE